ncbi:MAG: omptin family outer membrane protease [Hyphomicrobiaceae bacterium]
MVRFSRRGAVCASILTCAFALATPAIAGDMFGIRDEAFDDPLYTFKIDAELSAGQLSGTSHELVYDARTGQKISELIWTMDDVAVIGGKLSARPSHWWSVDLAGWTNVTQEATMDDYDWISPLSTDWSHWSHHNATNLERALMIDASTKLTLWRESFFDLNAIAGYRWDKFDWTAKGGSFVYSSDVGFRDMRFVLPPDMVGISYQQEFRTPYVGLGGHLRLGDFSVEANVLTSWWVTASDVDVHHLRWLEFQESFDGGNMLRYDIQGRYQLTDSLAIKAAWEHTDYTEMKGPVRVSIAPGGPGLAYFPGDSAGADHESDIVSAGVVYTFE